MHEPIDETALVAALKAGEEWAFELMVRTFGGRLLAVARRFMRNDSTPILRELRQVGALDAAA